MEVRWCVGLGVWVLCGGGCGVVMGVSGCGRWICVLMLWGARRSVRVLWAAERAVGQCCSKRAVGQCCSKRADLPCFVSVRLSEPSHQRESNYSYPGEDATKSRYAFWSEGRQFNWKSKLRLYRSP